MEIVLREPLNTSHKLNAGVTVDWDRPVITSISRQLGRTDWFEPLGVVQQRERSMAVQTVERKGKVK